MSFRPVRRTFALAGLWSAAALSVAAQSVDPAVVGERLQRLNATVESLEQTSVSQKRQIDGLSAEMQRLREENSRELANLASRSSQRPWAEDLKRQGDEIRRHTEDLKRLADAISEVDRKRAADHEQVLKVLGELKKAVNAIAEAPPTRPAPSRPAPEPRSKPERDGGDTEKAPPVKDSPPVKAVPYTVGKGESLSIIVDGFNADAKKKGYQTLSVPQVMRFNKITDARKVREGATINLPLIPKAEKP